MKKHYFSISSRSKGATLYFENNTLLTEENLLGGRLVKEKFCLLDDVVIKESISKDKDCNN